MTQQRTEQKEYDKSKRSQCHVLIPTLLLAEGWSVLCLRGTSQDSARNGADNTLTILNTANKCTLKTVRNGVKWSLNVQLLFLHTHCKLKN